MSSDLEAINPAAAEAALPVDGGGAPGFEQQIRQIRQPFPMEPPEIIPDPTIVPVFTPPPIITSVQPSSIPAGSTSNVVVTGANLPINPAAYSVNAPGVQVVNTFGTSNSSTLSISVPATTPSGVYQLRVQSGGSSAMVPLAITPAVNLSIRIDSVQPSRIPAGSTSTVQVSGANLPPSAANYSVVGANGLAIAGVQVVSAFGSATQVTLQIAVAANAPLGTAFLRASVPGSAAQFPLEIFQGFGIVIFSVQPNQLSAGATTRVTITGSNLPVMASSYTVQGPTGSIGASIVLVFATIDGTTGNATSVTLDITVPAPTPSGFYRIRAQSGSFGAEAPVQIVASAGLRITSVQPATLLAGTVTTLFVTGSGLPVSQFAYTVVSSFGQPVLGVQVLAAFGSPTQVTLQISVAFNVPTGAYRLRVQNGGQVAEFPITIFGRIGFSELQ